MAWKRGPSNPKYHTREHKAERARLVREMQARGYLWCAQPQCLKASRAIHAGEQWHLGHDDTGTQFIGPCHATCNVKDGARRGRARQLAPRGWTL